MGRCELASMTRPLIVPVPCACAAPKGAANSARTAITCATGRGMRTILGITGLLETVAGTADPLFFRATSLHLVLSPVKPISGLPFLFIQFIDTHLCRSYVGRFTSIERRVLFCVFRQRPPRSDIHRMNTRHAFLFIGAMAACSPPAPAVSTMPDHASANRLLGKASPGAATPLTTQDSAWIESIIASLSPRERVAQLVMPWVPGE